MFFAAWCLRPVSVYFVWFLAFCWFFFIVSSQRVNPVSDITSWPEIKVVFWFFYQYFPSKQRSSSLLVRIWLIYQESALRSPPSWSFFWLSPPTLVPFVENRAFILTGIHSKGLMGSHNGVHQYSLFVFSKCCFLDKNYCFLRHLCFLFPSLS